MHLKIQYDEKSWKFFETKQGMYQQMTFQDMASKQVSMKQAQKQWTSL
jgi:hypothetical protein